MELRIGVQVSISLGFKSCKAWDWVFLELFKECRRALFRKKELVFRVSSMMDLNVL
jgi:hypothetical protein